MALSTRRATSAGATVLMFFSTVTCAFTHLAQANLVALGTGFTLFLGRLAAEHAAEEAGWFCLSSGFQTG